MLECVFAASAFWLYGVGAWGGTFVINVAHINKIYVGKSADVYIETTNESSTSLSSELFTVATVLEAIRNCDSDNQGASDS